MSKRVMFYVQHLLGVGHLKRASLIARAMSASGLDVTVALGGPEVEGVDFGGCARVLLPSARAADETFKTLLDEHGEAIDEAWRDSRSARLLHAFEAIDPDVLLVEQFPLGRRQFRFELSPARGRAHRPALAPDRLVRARCPGAQGRSQAKRGHGRAGPRVVRQGARARRPARARRWTRRCRRPPRSATRSPIPATSWTRRTPTRWRATGSWAWRGGGFGGRRRRRRVRFAPPSPRGAQPPERERLAADLRPQPGGFGAGELSWECAAGHRRGSVAAGFPYFRPAKLRPLRCRADTTRSWTFSRRRRAP